MCLALVSFDEKAPLSVTENFHFFLKRSQHKAAQISENSFFSLKSENFTEKVYRFSENHEPWSSSYERPSDQSGSGVGAKAPTPNIARLAPQCAGLPELVERPAFGRNRCNSGSSLEHDSPADPKMGAVAAVLVENGPRTTIVALNRG